MFNVIRKSDIRHAPIGAQQSLVLEAVEEAYEKLGEAECDAIDRECALLRRELKLRAPNVRIGEAGLREILAKLGCWLNEHAPAEVAPVDEPDLESVYTFVDGKLTKRAEVVQ